MCKQIQENYSSCDVSSHPRFQAILPADRKSKISDALLVLKVPYAGHLSDIRKSWEIDFVRNYPIDQPPQYQHRTQTARPDES
jgi:hypothetical protein